MRRNYAKLLGVSLAYGSVCFLIWWGASAIGWRLFPDPTKGDELIRQMHWVGHTVADKLAGLFLLSVTAFLASRAHHPTGKWGVATGIAAAVAYQLIAVLVYALRFGVTTYRDYNDLGFTMLWTVLLGWLFGYIAVRRQCLHERQPA